MKPDIADRKGIELLVNTFYDTVKVDATIGYMFLQIIGTDWSHHLPVMYAFWESVLLGKAGYMGNPVKKHVDLDSKLHLKKEHFDHWLQLWGATVDQLFEGTIADMAKNKASLMAHLMNMKIEMSHSGNFIQ